MLFRFRKISVFVLLITACSSENETITPIETFMPPYTEEGLNTGGFKVNGKVVVARNDDYKPILADYYKKFNTDLLKVRILNISQYNNEFVYINIYNISDTGLYFAQNRCELCDSNSISYSNERIGNGYTYYATKDHVGVIRITKFDTVNKVVAGRFYFTGKLFENGDEKDTIRISEGQFDAKYNQ